MDYCGDGIGIRLSEEQGRCWIIFKYGTRWDTYGDAHPLGDLLACDLQTESPYSPLRLAWTVLSCQNPQGQSDLWELINRAKKPPAEGAVMSGELSRAYEAKKLELKAAWLDYLRADRDFVSRHEKLQRILGSRERLTSEDIPTFLSAVLECSLALAVQQEKAQRVDEVSGELGALLQELNAPPKGE